MKLLEVLWLVLGFALLLALPSLLSGGDIYSTLLYLSFFTIFLAIFEKRVKPSRGFSKRKVQSS